MLIITPKQTDLGEFTVRRALPAVDEEIEPAFYHYEQAQIPKLKNADGDIAVIMGKAYGLSSPVKTFSQTLYVEIKLQKGATLSLPQAEQLGIYVVKGELAIADHKVAEQQFLILPYNTQADITAHADCHLVMIGGERFPPRFIEWYFVSSRKQRIAQAKQDWLSGQFPSVIGDEEDFIPLPK